MSVLIGHASIDENGKTIGGNAGDQTNKEVCVRAWYNKPWSTVLRPVPSIAEALAEACEAGCANINIGYDQGQRNTLHAEAKKVGYDLSKITTPCETDCSAFMTVCAIAAGVKGLEYTGNAPTTSTMTQRFCQTGQFQALTDKKYLTTDEYLMRGDILLKPGSHTAMVLSNGSMAGAAIKTVDEIAEEVITGQWGNGTRRRELLEAAGYNYKTIQEKVTRLINGTAEHISQDGIDFIKKYESCVLTAYKLTGERYYTIGWGHNGADVLADMTISQERADEMFRQDIVIFENYVKKYAKIVLTQPRLDALTSYTYNRGPGGMKKLAEHSSSVQEYADNIVVYWGSAARYKDALIKRRKAEREMFLSS